MVCSVKGDRCIVTSLSRARPVAMGVVDASRAVLGNTPSPQELNY